MDEMKQMIQQMMSQMTQLQGEVAELKQEVERSRNAAKAAGETSFSLTLDDYRGRRDPNRALPKDMRMSIPNLLEQQFKWIVADLKQVVEVVTRATGEAQSEVERRMIDQHALLIKQLNRIEEKIHSSPRY